MIVLRYRRERMNLLRYLLKWYNKVRLMLAIDHLERIVKGREKLNKLMRYKPSKILYKKMKLMNPKFYKSKGDKLIKALIDIAKKNPFKRFIDNMRLINRINKLKNIQPRIREKVEKYLLKKYLDKWKENVEKLNEQKIKLLLTYIKKKIKDEKTISNQRKNELLKRFILNREKNKINNLLLAFKVWKKLVQWQKEQKPLVHEKEGNLVTMLNGKEKIIEGNDIRKGGEINIKLKKNEEGKFTIENIINNNLTENERQEIIKKKIPATINLIDDKLKSLMLMKLYKWKNITNKIVYNKNARIIQKFIKEKVGNLLWKKRVKFFNDLAKKYFIKKLLGFAKMNNLDKITRKIIYKKLSKNLKKIVKNKNNIISLNDNILNANDDLKSKNKKIALKNVLKLYSYVVIKKLFENISNLQKIKFKIFFKEFINKLNQNLIKKSEYTYEKEISNENIPYKKKLSFSKKISSNNIPKKEINESIPLISLLPPFIKFLENKIDSRKRNVFDKINQYSRNQKLIQLVTKYINKKLIPEKELFLNNFEKLSKTGEKQKNLFKLLRKYFIKKKLFNQIDGPAHILKLIFLIKLSIINQEIKEKRWIRVLIRKWRFLTFSHNISKKKMSALYKNFHINYLEMVKDVFGEEKFDNPSVIKEFERFGTSVGMWENEHPNFIEEGKLSKNLQKKFESHKVKKIDNNKEENKNIINNEIKGNKDDDNMNKKISSLDGNDKKYLKENLNKK